MLTFVAASFAFHFIALGMLLGVREKPLTRRLVGAVFCYLFAFHLAMGLVFARFPSLMDPRV